MTTPDETTQQEADGNADSPLVVSLRPILAASDIDALKSGGDLTPEDVARAKRSELKVPEEEQLLALLPTNSKKCHGMAVGAAGLYIVRQVDADKFERDFLSWETLIEQNFEPEAFRGTPITGGFVQLGPETSFYVRGSRAKGPQVADLIGQLVGAARPHFPGVTLQKRQQVGRIQRKLRNARSTLTWGCALSAAVVFCGILLMMIVGAFLGSPDKPQSQSRVTIASESAADRTYAAEADGWFHVIKNDSQTLGHAAVADGAESRPTLVAGNSGVKIVDDRLPLRGLGEFHKVRFVADDSGGHTLEVAERMHDESKGTTFEFSFAGEVRFTRASGKGDPPAGRPATFVLTDEALRARDVKLARAVKREFVQSAFVQKMKAAATAAGEGMSFGEPTVNVTTVTPGEYSWSSTITSRNASQTLTVRGEKVRVEIDWPYRGLDDELAGKLADSFNVAFRARASGAALDATQNELSRVNAQVNGASRRTGQ